MEAEEIRKAYFSTLKWRVILCIPTIFVVAVVTVWVNGGHLGEESRQPDAENAFAKCRQYFFDTKPEFSGKLRHQRFSPDKVTEVLQNERKACFVVQGTAKPRDDNYKQTVDYECKYVVAEKVDKRWLWSVSTVCVESANLQTKTNDKGISNHE